MLDENNNSNNANAPRARARDSYQPKIDKTYSPMLINGNYTPVIPTALANQQPTPPVGDSGRSSGEIQQHRSALGTFGEKHLIGLNSQDTARSSANAPTAITN